MRWIAAIAGALLLAVAAFLWRSNAADPSAALESMLAEAEAQQQAAIGAKIDLRALREHLEHNPRDARAWVLFARMQAERDAFGESAAAYEKALALAPKVAKDPVVWCEYADALAMAQGGKLAGRPRELVDRALALVPDHPKALEMAGSAEYEQGRYRQALVYWRPLLARLAPQSQLHRELAGAIERTQLLADATPAGEVGSEAGSEAAAARAPGGTRK